MPETVVITRPLAQAIPLAQRVSALGLDAAVFPLLDIQPLPDPSALRAALADLSGYALIAFVSPNAIDSACAIRATWPRELMLAVMGEGSRAALARHGLTEASAAIVSPHDAQRTDSQTLLEALDLDALRGRRALIVRGESGREMLADALRGAGVEVVQVAAYRRCAPVFNEARRAELRRLLDCDSLWIITSSEALRYLVDMARQLGTEESVAKLQRKNLLVPHVRIKETACALGFTRICLTGSGDEAMLAALQFRG